MAKSGRHFLQIPGPTNVPDRVLRALSKPTIDHRGPGVRRARQRGAGGTEGRVPDGVAGHHLSGFRHRRMGGSLVNTLSPGDKVLMFETGHFATCGKRSRPRWAAGRLDDRRLAARRRSRVVFEKLADDRGHTIKAVCVVHNETSTGVVSRIGEIRKQMDAARHPALLLVDTISSLGSIEYRTTRGAWTSRSAARRKD
jgi:alanine-glyoxylate transaminase/serine-glyoxylate transaminase/serine-pyruvate transaminase